MVGSSQREFFLDLEGGTVFSWYRDSVCSGDRTSYDSCVRLRLPLAWINVDSHAHAHARKQITITLARCTDPCQLSSCGQLASQPARQDARTHSDSSGGAPAQFSWLASGGQLVEANHGSSQPAVVRYLAAHRVGAVSCSLSLNLNSFPPMRNQCETSAKPMRNPVRNPLVYSFCKSI